MRVKKISLRLLALVMMITAGLVLFADGASAATLSVNSNGDTQANDGACTLREAIVAANTDTVSGAAVGECAAGSGTDTINFAITGPADFTNGGQNGHTIAPTSALPDITEPVVINGYSQTGAQANTAAAPLPLNGRLLIEIDGTNAGTANGLRFTTNSDGSAVRGLVINNFANGDGIMLFADAVQVQGNYIGTNPAGTIARPNVVGVNSVYGDPNRRKTRCLAVWILRIVI
jgi:CSLREA domain-containing protein